MTWAKTLRAWTLGEEVGTGAPEAVAGPLAQLVADLRWRASELERHADQAPNEAADVELRQIATDTKGTADHLSTRLGSQAPTPDAGEPTAALPGDSHWARLVQDLEDMRAIRSRLLRLAAIANDVADDLAATIEQAFRAVEAALLRLRGLIARADPQALN